MEIILFVILLVCLCFDSNCLKTYNKVYNTCYTSLLATVRSSIAEPTQNNDNPGQIYVCTNKWCREKGSDTTMAAFTFLTPESTPVIGVNCLSRCNKGNESMAVYLSKLVTLIVDRTKCKNFYERWSIH